jgi:hypothetical protein
VFELRFQAIQPKHVHGIEDYADMKPTTLPQTHQRAVAPARISQWPEKTDDWPLRATVGASYLI